MKKILLIILLLFPLLSHATESAEDKYNKLKTYVDLANDASGSCILHIKIYDNVDNEQCGRVLKIAKLMGPYKTWYKSLLADRPKARAFFKKGHSFVDFDTFNKNISYMGEFLALKSTK